MKCTRQRCQVALKTLAIAAFRPTCESEITSFADEFLGKMAVESGSLFESKIRLNNVADDNRHIISTAVATRKASDGGRPRRRNKAVSPMPIRGAGSQSNRRDELYSLRASLLRRAQANTLHRRGERLFAKRSPRSSRISSATRSLIVLSAPNTRSTERVIGPRPRLASTREPSNQRKVFPLAPGL